MGVVGLPLPCRKGALFFLDFSFEYQFNLCSRETIETSEAIGKSVFLM